MTTLSRAAEQSVECSAKIAKVLERRTRVAQDRLNDRIASAAKTLPHPSQAAFANPWRLEAAPAPRNPRLAVLLERTTRRA